MGGGGGGGGCIEKQAEGWGQVGEGEENQQVLFVCLHALCYAM